MAYSDNFPAQRPVFMADFANGGKIDPRATFSRADTPPTYAAPSAVHYWSNEKHLSSYNAFTKSEGISNWILNNVTPTANAVVAPDGNTTADTIAGNSGTADKYVVSNVVYDDNPVISIYAKAGTHNFIQIVTNAHSQHYANFDLTSGAGSVGDTGSSTTATIQAVGSTGWYRCIARFEVTGSSYVGRVVLVDSATSARMAVSATTGTVHLWGAMANNQGDLTNIVAYQSSTGQIHREYAPTLKSVATAGQPRFEYDPSADGQSVAKGILIEGQSTNLLGNSADFGGSWQILNATKSIEAIGPDGTLSAIAFREGTNSNEKRLFSYFNNGGGNVTFSVYAKILGNARRLVIREAIYTGLSAVFDLATGTKVSGNGSIESVGNGWHRCQLNFSSSQPTPGVAFYIIPADGESYTASAFAGDGYSGLLLTMPQAENQSFASSYINTGTGGGAATRAAESLSVATADIGYTGGPFTIVSETAGGQGYYPRAFTLTNGNLSNRVVVYRDSSSASGSTNWLAYCESDGSFQGALTIPSSASAGKLAVSYNTNDVSVCASGGTVATDSSAVISDALTTLRIGTNYIGAEQLNGHCKRIAIYNEALSDSNLQAVTS